MLPAMTLHRDAVKLSKLGEVPMKTQSWKEIVRFTSLDQCGAATSDLNMQFSTLGCACSDLTKGKRPGSDEHVARNPDSSDLKRPGATRRRRNLPHEGLSVISDRPTPTFHDTT